MKAVKPPSMKPSQDAERIFQDDYLLVCRRIDRLIALIMGFQWPAAIIAALLVSPRTWEGGTSAIHPHLVVAIYLGGLVTIFPIYLAIFHAGEKFTRHVIAVCQMLMSGLLIHISGGRIETHFHVFGSLALIALYLDWEVLITATLTTLIDHSVMAYFAPLSIFGTTAFANRVFIEHVLWVVFFDSFLITACIQSIRALRAVAKREADQEGLLFQAYHDALTGLGNRLMMEKMMSGLASDQRQGGKIFALMALDLDRFKEVNDSLGHQVGDLVLIQVGERLSEEVREQDTLVRMGGDEFAIVLADCADIEFVDDISQRIIKRLNQPFSCGDHIVHIGISIGVCINRGTDFEYSDISHRADLALYKVKNAGRNRYLIFDEDTQAETLYQMSLENRVRNAIHSESMHLHYQPIVSMEGLLLGFEALLRWTDSLYGEISPAEFIPVAEKAGLIVPLGNWVIRRACAQAAEWHRTGNKVVKMSINVSSTQIAHPEFVTTVLQALNDSGLPPELLDLELTENTLLQNYGGARQALYVLSKLGVRLSIDNFGMGNSSLNYIREIQVHTLKIDRTFIRDIATSNEARLGMESMIAMAHELNLRVVAEGVENRSQMELLSLAGCDEIQGFHISKAISSDEAANLLHENELSNRDSSLHSRSTDGASATAPRPVLVQ